MTKKCIFGGAPYRPLFPVLDVFVASLDAQSRVWDNWKTFKNDEKSFLFHVNSCFCSWDTYSLTWLFGYKEKRLDKKGKVNFKIFEITDWTTNN